SCGIVHGGRYGDLTQVGTACCSRTRLGEGFKQVFKVFFELVDLERSTTNRGMNNTGTISAVLNLTCLCIFYCSSNIRGHSTHAWVGHQTTGTQNLSQRTHNTHSIW